MIAMLLSLFYIQSNSVNRSNVTNLSICENVAKLSIKPCSFSTFRENFTNLQLISSEIKPSRKNYEIYTAEKEYGICSEHFFCMIKELCEKKLNELKKEK
ncbi:putative SP-containing protein [Vairimorpha necatrix]|uniref:SP-containing protein n=1 Tax=Vairimorpha necatrix TaxID=6039 RepID=A0AAX4J9R0_9MICR